MRTATRIKPTANPPKEKHVRPIRPTRIGQFGAPQIYDKVRFPHIAETLCAEYGFTSKQLADVFGVSKITVDGWMKIHEEFKIAVKAGKDRFDGEKVENALLKRALGYSYTETTETKIYLFAKDDITGTNVKIPARKRIITTKELPPDVKACMFWLSNRQSERWNLVSNVKATVSGSVEHKHSGTVVTAQLENLNDHQLLALRDMVAAQSSNEPLQIAHNAEDSPFDMSTIMAAAAEIQKEMYGEAEDAEFEEIQ